MRKPYRFKGTKYQSKGEYEIAKFLNEMNIDFEYEFPIAVVDQNKAKIWYPDFYLKEYQIVIEYFGMYNHNEGYKDVTEHKKDIYKACGIQFLPIYELNTNWKEYVLRSILSHLEHKKDKMNKIVDRFYKNRTPDKKKRTFIEKVLSTLKKK